MHFRRDVGTAQDILFVSYIALYHAQEGYRQEIMLLSECKLGFINLSQTRRDKFVSQLT